MRKIILALFLLGLAGCTSPTPAPATPEPVTSTPLPVVTLAPSPTPAPCLSDALDAQITSLLARFDDAASLGQDTPRGQLADVIADMQAIRREVDTLPASLCLDTPLSHLRAYMDPTLEAFADFLAERSYPLAIQNELDAALEARAAFLTTYYRQRIDDGLLTGTLEPAPLKAIQITTQPDRTQTIIELTNVGAFPLAYVSGFVVHHGTLLEPVFFLTLAPGATERIEFARTTEMINQGISAEGLTVQIDEMYSLVK